jgi:FkbM family methyltransferase
MKIFIRIENWINKYKNKARLIRKGDERNLYRTIYGDYYWLSKKPHAHIDACIRESSVFEKNSTNIIRTLVKHGGIVLDIGANIGYYSVIMSKLVGIDGKVICFEPTMHYRDVLKKNIEINNLNNIEVFSFGLSNRKQEMEISIGASSATLHEPEETINNKKREIVYLRTLDECISDMNIDRIDFIKIDVDGHEPAFLEGAIKSIEKYSPVILLEVNHLNYIESDICAWDFYDSLIEQGFYVYSEIGLTEFASRSEFLKECGNFAYSANIVITKNKLNIRP